MQTFICNVCERPLDGAAFEFSMISGKPAAVDRGVTRIAHREQVRLLHLCNRCGEWLLLGIRTLGESLAGAYAIRADTRWIDPSAPEYGLSTE